MNRGSKWMKIGRRAIAAACVLALALTLAAPSRAQVADETEPAPTGWVAGVDEPSADRWWGVMGAIICGAEIRVLRTAPAIGMNPYLLAAGIGGCLLAGLDVMTTT